MFSERTSYSVNAWEGIWGLQCCQLSTVVLRLTSLCTVRILKVCEQNGGLQEMPIKAGIARHVHHVG